MILLLSKRGLLWEKLETPMCSVGRCFVPDGSAHVRGGVWGEVIGLTSASDCDPTFAIATTVPGPLHVAVPINLLQQLEVQATKHILCVLKTIVGRATATESCSGLVEGLNTIKLAICKHVVDDL